MLSRIQIRMIKPWGAYCVGDTLNPGGVLRDMLIQRGFAVIQGETTNKPPKKRGRPRKSK